MAGNKYDTGKPRISLLSSDAIIEIAKVATMGAEKYDDHNWRKGMKWSRLMDAAERHLLDYNKGDRIDKESGLSHLAHVAWNFMALLEYEINNVGEDDLFKGHKKEEIIPEKYSPSEATMTYLENPAKLFAAIEKAKDKYFKSWEEALNKETELNKKIESGEIETSDPEEMYWDEVIEGKSKK